MTLTDSQRQRYARNMLIPGFGEAGQSRLIRARVLVVGLGGLGSPVAYYLAAAGVGTLCVMDCDRVELSNLQRQILHRTANIGMPKSRSAAEALSALNPEIHIETYDERLTKTNAADLLSKFDAIVEASDNFDTKFLINDVCLELDKPFAAAGILALSGQALFVVPGKTACLRCVLPTAPENEPSTAVLGVLGAVPGVLGSLEAMEVLRWLVGVWKAPDDRAVLVHSLDGDGMRLRTVRVPPRNGCLCKRLWSKT